MALSEDTLLACFWMGPGVVAILVVAAAIVALCVIFFALHKIRPELLKIEASIFKIVSFKLEVRTKTTSTGARQAAAVTRRRTSRQASSPRRG